MMLWLNEALAQTIVLEAVKSAPGEACGVIGGVGSQAIKIIPAANTAQEPRYQYRIDDKVLVESAFALAREGLEIVAFYHSHPNGDALPSPSDVAQAYYPEVPYLIVGLGMAQTQMAAWQIGNGEVNPVALHIGSTPPDLRNDFIEDRKEAVVIASAFIAAVFMIILSLALLPPAPAIP